MENVKKDDAGRVVVMIGTLKVAEFRRIDEGEKTTIVIEGALDALTTPELNQMVDGIVDDCRSDIVVDMEKTTLLDASGVGVLVIMFKRIKKLDMNFRVKFEGVRDQPRAVLRLNRLDRVFGLE